MSRPSRMQADVARAAPIFAALGDRTRLGLVARLCAKGPQSIAELTEGSAVTRQAVTKHLDVLSRAGVVHGLRRGRERIWDLDTKRLGEAVRFLDRASQTWDDALLRLKRFVED